MKWTFRKYSSRQRKTWVIINPEFSIPWLQGGILQSTCVPEARPQTTQHCNFYIIQDTSISCMTTCKSTMSKPSPLTTSIILATTTRTTNTKTVNYPTNTCTPTTTPSSTSTKTPYYYTNNDLIKSGIFDDSSSLLL